MKHSKRVLSAAVAFSALLGVGAASAADLPLKAPPMAAPEIPSWAGFYVGGEVGSMWTRDRLTESTAFVPPLTGNATTNSTSATGGIYAGYNWQFGHLVVGPEADIEATGLSSNNTCQVQDFGAGNVTPGACFPPAGSYNFTTKMPWQGSVRARIGYTSGNALFYATGGVAFAEVDTSYSTNTAPFAPLGAQSFNQTRAGATAGAGVEYKWGHWIGRLEYRWADFGTLTNTITSAGGFWNGYNDIHHVSENTVRVGLSYLFNGGPVVAKY